MSQIYRLLLCTELNCAEQYRGVEREEPYYLGPLDDIECNNLLNWFFNLDKDEELKDYYNDYAKLTSFLKCYETYYSNSLQYGQKFQIIELTESEHVSRICSDFLGFDVAASYRWSIIKNLIDFFDKRNNLAELANESDNEIAYIYAMVGAAFREKLNHNFLFELYEDALFFQKTMQALLKKLNTFAFEAPQDYQVLGVWE